MPIAFRTSYCIANAIVLIASNKHSEALTCLSFDTLTEVGMEMDVCISTQQTFFRKTFGSILQKADQSLMEADAFANILRPFAEVMVKAHGEAAPQFHIRLMEDVKDLIHCTDPELSDVDGLTRCVRNFKDAANDTFKPVRVYDSGLAFRRRAETSSKDLDRIVASALEVSKCKKKIFDQLNEFESLQPFQLDVEWSRWKNASTDLRALGQDVTEAIATLQDKRVERTVSVRYDFTVKKALLGFGSCLQALGTAVQKGWALAFLSQCGDHQVDERRQITEVRDS